MSKRTKKQKSKKVREQKSNLFFCFCDSEKYGFSLVELILAVALFGLFAPALLGLLMNSYGSDFQAQEKDRANLYAQEGLEAVWSIRRQAWNLLENGDHGLTNFNDYWQFSGSSNLLDNKYIRIVTIADACRNINGNLIDCAAPGATIDLQTKKVTVKVTYTAITGVNNEVTLASYLTTWQSKDWLQTDWVGGFGQTIWSDATKYDSDDGNINSSIAGQISLISLGSPCQNNGSCAAAPPGQCNKCETAGCAKSGSNCLGSLDCSLYADQNSCEDCGQCHWLGGGSSCTGTPTPCGNFVDQPSCQTQAGCSWSSYTCQNNSSCSAASSGQCNKCDTAGCVKSGPNCSGSLDCLVYTDQTSCQKCSQCTWLIGSGSCLGTPTPCGSFVDQPTCQAQVGCSWNAGGSYAPSGYLVSSAFNTGNQSSFNLISWSQVIPVCTPSCAIKVQIRAASNNGGVPGIWTAWYGVSGPGAYFINPAEELIPTALNFNQWLQYRVELSGDGLNTPVLQDIKINYTP